MADGPDRNHNERTTSKTLVRSRVQRLPSCAVALLAGALVGCSWLGRTQPPADRPQPLDDALIRADAPIQAWWIGHATVLVRIEDRWLITDPIFSSSIAGVLRRRVAPGIDLRGMPALDWILISHSHFDHLDLDSLDQLDACARLATPPDVEPHLPDARTERLTTLEAWRSVIDRGMTITAVPVRHGDDRYFVDKMWRHRGHTGFVVRYRGHTLFFAGDTGYDEKSFQDIGRSFDVDLALIPVGPVGGVFSSINRRSHVAPDEAMQVLSDVKARWMLPIHYGTFFRAPGKERADVVRAMVEHGVQDRVIMLSPGESVALTPTPAKDHPRRHIPAGSLRPSLRSPTIGGCAGRSR